MDRLEVRDIVTCFRVEYRIPDRTHHAYRPLNLGNRVDPVA